MDIYMYVYVSRRMTKSQSGLCDDDDLKIKTLEQKQLDSSVVDIQEADRNITKTIRMNDAHHDPLLLFLHYRLRQNSTLSTHPLYTHRQASETQSRCPHSSPHSSSSSP